MLRTAHATCFCSLPDTGTTECKDIDDQVAKINNNYQKMIMENEFEKQCDCNYQQDRNISDYHLQLPC